MRINNNMSAREVRRFVERNIGRRVDVDLIGGANLEGVILSAGVTTFPLHIRRRGRNIVRRIAYTSVREINLDRD
ncbi:hypothetical protein [Paenibacillus sp. OSY-SE]|uniref:hypothetical protein n=1 Tax=Paenibacillus sp. OSY-SE TaxID=1196323 RepID=UPI0002FD460F|nr:hypothetical protein [Paenibacillus sp. OSY-SE]